MYTLYQMQMSGNCYKLRLLMAQLGIPFRLVDLDLFAGENRSIEFLHKNITGQVPVLEFPDGRTLAESNAILYYLAELSGFLPPDPYSRAQILRWMFFEQYSHEPYIAVARFWRVFVPGGFEKKKDRFPEWLQRGEQALGIMETHLQGNDFFAGFRYSIADISLYAYTHVAEDGGFELSHFPAVQAWLGRVSSIAGHVPLQWRPD